MLPIRLRLGVPRASAASIPAYPSAGRLRNTASSGAATISGSPVVEPMRQALGQHDQLERGGGEHQQVEAPSSLSSWNSRSKDKRQASSAVTQMMPGAMRARMLGSGPTPKGRG